MFSENQVISQFIVLTKGISYETANKLADEIKTITKLRNIDSDFLNKFNNPIIQKNAKQTLLAQIPVLKDLKSKDEIAYWTLAKKFITERENEIKKLKLDDISINPLLVPLIGSSSKEIVSYFVYQAASRGLVTAWGFVVQKMATVSGTFENVPDDDISWENIKSKMKTKGISVKGMKPDIKNSNEFVQVKSGPNTMNDGMVSSLSDVITQFENIGETCILGMTYGKENEISSIMSQIPKAKRLNGKDFWEHVSGEKDHHEKIIHAINIAATKPGLLAVMNAKIEELTTEWDKKFAGKDTPNVMKSFY